MAVCTLRVPASPSACTSSSGQSQAAGGFQCRPCTGAQVLGQKGFLGSKLSLEAAAPAATRSRIFSVRAAKKVSTGRSFVLSSTLAAEEGKEEEVASLCRGLLQWAREKQSDKNSGIQIFECNADPYEKNVVHFLERYDSYTHMNDIRASPEHTKFMNDVRPFLTGPVGLACYEYVDGKIGNMLNPIGPKGEGGLDDATGQSGTKQQSSAINMGLGESDDRKDWGMDKMLAKIAAKEEAEGKKAGWNVKDLFGGKKE